MKTVTALMIKFSNGYKHYRVRNALINNNIINSECPRYSKTEMWDHIIRCKETKNLRRKFTKELTLEIIKAKPSNACVNDIFDIMQDVL